MLTNKTNIKHLAVTLDGNGRWATTHRVPKVEGHRAGTEAVKKLIQNVMGYGIPYLTIYALSSENLLRPEQEVSDVMGLLGYFLNRELSNLHKNGIRLKIIGNLERFSPDLRKKLYDAVELTKDNKNLTLFAAVGYGSKAEITQACASVVRAGIKPEDITEQTIADHLYDPQMPDVDLFIRPSGDIRISNFLLWQSAYAEFYFPPVLWPDFDAKDLDEAIANFASRKRNFGYSRDQKR